MKRLRALAIRQDQTQVAAALCEGSAELPAAYGVLKLRTTLTSFLLGIPGGIFAPSLSIGAGLGENLSVVVPYAPAGAVVILGAVAYFAGVIRRLYEALAESFHKPAPAYPPLPP